MMLLKMEKASSEYDMLVVGGFCGLQCGHGIYYPCRISRDVVTSGSDPSSKAFSSIAFVVLMGPPS